MGSVEAPLSLNGRGCITADIVPHYLQPSTGSCHDICKYGRRRAFQGSTPRARRHSFVANKPSPHGKSFSPRPKNRSRSPTKRRWNSSNNVKRGAVLPAKDQVHTSAGSVMPKPGMVKPSVSERRKSDAGSGRNRPPKKAWVPVGAPLLLSPSSKGRQTARVELKDRRKVKTDSSNALESIQVEEDQKIKGESLIVSNELDFEDAPSTSCHEETDETVSQRMRKKRRMIKQGDKHSQPMRLKFRSEKQMHLHKINNAPTSLKFRRTRRKEDDSVSGSNNPAWIGSVKTLRSTDKHGSKASKNRCSRVRYGKPRVVVLEDRKGDLKKKYNKVDGAGAELLLRKNNLKHQEIETKKDVRFVLSHVIDETASKLAERRKGMVKSLVGAYEMLISLQTRNCFLHVRFAS